MNRRNKKQLSTNRGVALFIAVLMGSIALTIGMGVLNITLKELKLSSLSRDSMSAFFAADTGLECALYWDDVRTLNSPSSIFATSTDLTPPADGSLGQNKQCATNDITSNWTVVSITPTGATTIFKIPDPCSTVTVIKNNGQTVVDSRGYNTCDTSSARRVERGLRVSY